ncbi:hypothetical protein ACH4OT_17105 [Streptomyces murinus]|uniref:hypothetical protein n=1 Tax=Streptomyces murinus TaxID=33900 RepID=UPI0037878A06
MSKEASGSFRHQQNVASDGSTVHAVQDGNLTVNYVSYDAETKMVSLESLHRNALSTARGLRYRPALEGTPVPKLRTDLAAVLEEIDDPTHGAERMRRASQALRTWATWVPDCQDLHLTGDPASAAVGLWAQDVELRQTCVSELDESASALAEVSRIGDTAAYSLLARALSGTAEVVDSMSKLSVDLLSAQRGCLPEVSEMSFRQRLAAGRLLAIVTDLRACADFLNRICTDPALGGRLTGGMLVGGGWGTGKSYGVAGWVERRIDVGRPTALVCGYQFDGSRGFEDQLAENCGAQHACSAQELLSSLQKHAREHGQHAVLVVDALNEAAAVTGDPQEAFAALLELAAEFPDVTVVATLRMDHPPPAVGSAVVAIRDRRYAFQWNAGVRDPLAAWRMYQDMYGLPPLVLPPDVRDLRRPLLLSVLAYSIHRSPKPENGPVTVPSMDGLFRKWLRALDADWARYRGHGAIRDAPPVVGRACELIAEVIGVQESVEFGTVLRALGDHGFADAERIVYWLCGVGVLGVDPVYGHVRFAVQRFAEHIRARNLLGGPRPDRAVARLARDLDGGKQTSAAAARMMEALAGAAPHMSPGTELFCLLPRCRPLRADLIVLESLEGREPVPGDERGAQAIAFLRKKLRHPQAAPWAWYTVLVNSTDPGHHLGVAFLDAALSDTRGSKHFHRRFVLPILKLIDNPDGLDLLRRFLAWAATQSTQERSALDTTTLLLWLSAVPYAGLRDLCVRTASDLWLEHPEVALAQVERFGAHDDALIAEATWLAAYGALLRRTDGPPAEPWLALVERDSSRAHLRIHDAVAGIRALWDPGSRRGFPLQPLKLPRTAAVVLHRSSRMRRIQSLVSWCPFPEHSPVPRLSWLSRRSQRLQAVRLSSPGRRREKRPDWPEAMAEGKAPAIAAQEWYAVESWRHSRADPSPAPDADGAARYHLRTTDPTLSAVWPTGPNTVLGSSSWWGVSPDLPGLTGANQAQSRPASDVLTVSAPDGRSWWLLYGAFHPQPVDAHILGNPEDAAESTEELPVLRRPSNIIKEKDAWQSASPARQSSQLTSFVEINTFFVRVGAENRTVRLLRANCFHATLYEAWPSRVYLAEYYRRPECVPAGVPDVSYRPTTIIYPGTPTVPFERDSTLPYQRDVPTRQFIRQLGLCWTGRHLDFIDAASGAEILTDPSLIEGGPNCLLLAPTAAARLSAAGWTLLWHIAHHDRFLSERHRFAVLREGEIVDLHRPGDGGVRSARQPEG